MTKRDLKNLFKQNKLFIVFVALMFIFRSAIADWNDVPSGSMKPTILEGDRIFVNKMAYDLRVPFTLISLVKTGEPKRGDIIVFESEAAGKRLVKRVIGVPGDIVELRDNRLWINGQSLDYLSLGESGERFNSIDKIEFLPGAQHQIRVGKKSSYAASFAAVKVPEKAYLALGDNRDNSADSRVIGFVPRKEIVGKSTHVVLSLDYDNYFLPRVDRFFHEFALLDAQGSH